MDIKTYLDILHTAEKLKNQTRHCDTSSGRRESVAEHSWRMTLMAWFLKEEFPQADINKVIAMCIFHDMGEIFTGDIPTFEKTNGHEKKEEQLLDQWVESLPEPSRQELKELYAEMNALETLEAKIYKAIDKLEAVIQHNESDINTWLPLEYSLQLRYGKENVQFSEFFQNLKKEINQDTLQKIREEKKIQSAAVVGMGALGLLFGDTLARGLGRDQVSFVLDEERYESYQNRTFTINGEAKTFQLVKSSEAKPVDLLLVAVKYNSLPSALETMKNCVDEHTIILSVMNGIDSESIIGERFGKERVLCCVAQGMDAMKFGDALNFTKPGELRIGVFEENQLPWLEQVKEYFDRAKLPYTADEDILRKLWGKFMLNVGVNQTCMVYETNYKGTLTAGTEANHTMLAAMREVMHLANAEGIPLTENDLNYYVKLLGTLSPEGVPSMAQDAISKRPSEVEMFAGVVRRMSKKHGLLTPANDYLYEQVQKKEASYK